MECKYHELSSAGSVDEILRVTDEYERWLENLLARELLRYPPNT